MFDMSGGELFGKKKPGRKNFKVSTKKIEWNRAAGRADDDDKTTSKCRACGKRLVWGSGRYEFDHHNNRNSDNSQNNCRVKCRNCHGHETQPGVRTKRDMFGNVIERKRYMKKVGTKKSTRRKTRKKPDKRRELFGDDLFKIRI